MPFAAFSLILLPIAFCFAYALITPPRADFRFRLRLIDVSLLFIDSCLRALMSLRYAFTDAATLSLAIFAMMLIIFTLMLCRSRYAIFFSLCRRRPSPLLFHCFISLLSPIITRFDIITFHYAD